MRAPPCVRVTPARWLASMLTERSTLHNHTYWHYATQMPACLSGGGSSMRPAPACKLPLRLEAQRGAVWQNASHVSIAHGALSVRRCIGGTAPHERPIKPARPLIVLRHPCHSYDMHGPPGCMRRALNVLPGLGWHHRDAHQGMDSAPPTHSAYLFYFSCMQRSLHAQAW